MRHTPSKSIRVLIANAYDLERIGLGTLLRQAAEVEVVAEVCTSAAAISESARLHPDIVLVDGQAADAPVADVCLQLFAQQADTRVIVLTAADNDAAIFEAVDAGVQGVLLKQEAAQNLVPALRAVARGGAFLDPRVATRALHAIKTQTVPTRASTPIERLSRQERKLLPLLASGLTNKEMALALSLSDKTVKNYLHSVYRKLGVTRRSKAAWIYAEAVMPHTPVRADMVERISGRRPGPSGSSGGSQLTKAGGER